MSLEERTELLAEREVLECEYEVDHQERPAEERDQCSSPVAAEEQGEKKGCCEPPEPLALLLDVTETRSDEGEFTQRRKT